MVYAGRVFAAPAPRICQVYVRPSEYFTHFTPGRGAIQGINRAAVKRAPARYIQTVLVMK